MKLLSKSEVARQASELEPDAIYDALYRLLVAQKRKPETPACCNECGTNLKNDYLLECGHFIIDPRGAISYKGEEIPLTKTHICILHSLAKENGRFVQMRVLQERCCRETKSYVPKSIHVHINAITDIFNKLNIPLPFENKRAKGYRWQAFDNVT